MAFEVGPAGHGWHPLQQNGPDGGESQLKKKVGKWGKRADPTHGKGVSGACYMGVPEIGVPPNGWFIMDNPI